MSFRVANKMLRCLGISAFLWFAVPAVTQAQQGCMSCSPMVSCGPVCHTHHCPPPFKYTYEGGPRIHWRCGCPHPICNPCDLPHWGFYETCWSPYPFPPNWAHCLTPPPAAFVNLDPTAHPNMPKTPAKSGFGTPLPGPGPGMPPITTPQPGDPEEIPLNPPRRLENGR